MSETRTALVTGASRGLGAALALRLAAAGWHTVTCARDPQALAARAADGAAQGLRLHPVPADVTDEEAVTRLFDRIAQEAPPLGLCVNNAGGNYAHTLVGRRSPAPGAGGVDLRPHPLDAWRRTIDLCLTGTFLVGRGAAGAMLRAGTDGVIVNISSTVSRGAYAQSAYTAAKAGVEALTRTWAVELGDAGIRVLAVSPGVIDGDALRSRTAASPRHAAYMAAMLEQVPLRRWCTEDDVADAVLLAATNRAMTGTILEVDGGGIPARVVV
ncbi:3-oxoacyl-[acyl-carrier protein] reductase [Nocardioides zeae]|uniref:3-oxoacyl-[acyl-carrier protein] reductase n=2 Tax=Nocardioides zeae TaxID=1457234 RepID=A0ACC6II48_9ACTN|nr:SDR family NAD(P)-dependent oxidoreductase [Nocardioides zeae]MDQ1104106.1 3-oxoacyl-[acyl-carrier protein] reductase [Nocardioides zeae]MDR6176203.1 3-oxoacyl-[acyl-carrier protein] reductase [Nocardioides zeae]MDR6210349.1 3-oxoacyl-[acyl-carrier protein] reductase [Nocardioides zeae]